MTEKKKKLSFVLLFIGAVLAAYLGYLINGAWSQGMDINEFMESLNHVLAEPFYNYYEGKATVKAVTVAILTYDMAVLMYYIKQKKSDARQGIRNCKVCRYKSGKQNN